MSRKSGVWSSVGDDGASPQGREFLRWSEKIGKDFCIFSPSVLWTAPLYFATGQAGGEG